MMSTSGQYPRTSPGQSQTTSPGGPEKFTGHFVHGFRSELEDMITVIIGVGDLDATRVAGFDATGPLLLDWRLALAKHFGPDVAPSHRWVMVLHNDEPMEDDSAALVFGAEAGENKNAGVYRVILITIPRLEEVWGENPPPVEPAIQINQGRHRNMYHDFSTDREQYPDEFRGRLGFVGDWGNRWHVIYFAEMLLRARSLAAAMGRRLDESRPGGSSRPARPGPVADISLVISTRLLSQLKGPPTERLQTEGPAKRTRLDEQSGTGGSSRPARPVDDFYRTSKVFLSQLKDPRTLPELCRNGAVFLCAAAFENDAARQHFFTDAELLRLCFQVHGFHFDDIFRQNDVHLLSARVWQSRWFFDEILRQYDRRWRQIASVMNSSVSWLESPHWEVKSFEKMRGNAAADQHPLRFAPASVTADPRFMERAVRTDPMALQFASNEVKANKKVVLAAVGIYGEALKHAAPCLLQDPEVVATAVVSPYTLPQQLLGIRRGPRPASVSEALRSLVAESLHVLHDALLDQSNTTDPNSLSLSLFMTLLQALQSANNDPKVAARIVELRPSFYLQLPLVIQRKTSVALAAARSSHFDDLLRRKYTHPPNSTSPSSTGRGASVATRESGPPRIPAGTGMRAAPGAGGPAAGAGTATENGGAVASMCSSSGDLPFCFGLAQLLEHVPAELRKKKDFVLGLLDIDAQSGVQFVGEDLRVDEEIVKALKTTATLSCAVEMN